MVDTIEEAIEQIKTDIKANDVLLYMKGSPDIPQCGFSATVIAILKSLNIKFSFVNILEDNIMREAIKRHSDWPTFPQLYLKGDLIGGCDILKEMYMSGDLKDLFDKNKLLESN